MDIIRGFRDLLVPDHSLRNSELSIVETEGVMLDGNEEISYDEFVKIMKSV